MTKVKYLIVLILICIKASSFAASDHSFTIESMEGAPKRIDISYTRGSTGLAVSCATEKVYLDSYSAIRNIEVLQRKFLKITYSDLGGTGIESVKTALILVAKNKIIVCAYFSSIYNVDVPSKNSQSLVETELTVNRNKEYQLIAKSTEKFKDSNQKDKKISKADTLNFDRKSFVFRTGYDEYKSKKVNWYDSKTDRQRKKIVSGKRSVISLIGFKFIFIDGQWCQEDVMGNLYTSTYR